MRISIIIPVYNSEKYLHRCLVSVLNQSYLDFELLLINDGSSDSSGAICEEYASKDTRIKVFHQDNKGVSAARNLGLENARGEWIAFVDSDDYVGINYLKNTVNDVCDADIIITGLNKISGEEKKITIQFPNKLIDVEEKLFYLENFPLSDFGYPFAKFFKKNIIRKHHLRFNEDIHMFEDVIFLFKYIQFCNKIKFDDSSLYNYVIAENGSLSTKVNSFDSEYLAFITFYNQIIKELKITVEELYSIYPKLGYRLTALMNRSISTLYLKNYSSLKCIAAYKSYPSESWVLYKKFNEPRNFIKLVSKKLLISKKFSLADFILRISYKLIR